MRLLIALALVACGDHGAPRPQPGSAAIVAMPVELPVLPRSPDGAAELRGLDQRIATHRAKPADIGQTIGFLRERAAYRGQLDDYLEALALSKQWVEQAPDDKAAWRARFETLMMVHRFAEARDAMAHVPDREELVAALAEATGDLAPALAYRQKLAHDWPRMEHVARYAAALGAAGRVDEALATMRDAAKVVRDNPAPLFAWFLFQWGRLYELTGEYASARRFYEASRERMDTLEATVHLVQVLRATGDAQAAAKLAADAVATNPHPELLALAGRTAEARAAWERYVAALPEAFGDHAARFYLATNEPDRALVLARANLANRDTREARELLIEAALAAHQPAVACEVAPKLASEPLRASRFLAWRALSACGRTTEAAALGKALGI